MGISEGHSTSILDFDVLTDGTHRSRQGFRSVIHADTATSHPGQECLQDFLTDGIVFGDQYVDSPSSCETIGLGCTPLVQSRVSALSGYRSSFVHEPRRGVRKAGPAVGT